MTLLVAALMSCVTFAAARGADFTCEKILSTPYVVWRGTSPTMTAVELASYCAPILWFSPDEPLLEDRVGRDITIPSPFPFDEDQRSPVVYFRLRTVIARTEEGNPVHTHTGGSKSDAVLDMSNLVGVDLDFFFYYTHEEGFGAHEHDVESVEMKLALVHGDGDECKYALVVTRTVGKAHGVRWYDNTLESDAYTVFPIHILVEEAKHASCTDKNGDGYYTPGYDVNTRVNDAWGVRDIIRGGGLFAADWKSWMAKVRWEDTRVFPPLPPDSPGRARHSVDGEYAPNNAIYELRPFPTAEKASADLDPFISGKGSPDWPEVRDSGGLDKFGDWLTGESWMRSFSFALRVDGDLGVSFMFPFWLVKNLEDPLGGGYILHRVYLTGKDLRNFGYTSVYTTSASRWIDGYLGVGFENRVFDEPDGGTTSRNDFLLESGIKFRVNVEHSSFRFMRKLGTDFWGLRLGVRNFGGWTIEELGYVVEFGAGAF